MPVWPMIVDINSRTLEYRPHSWSRPWTPMAAADGARREQMSLSQGPLPLIERANPSNIARAELKICISPPPVGRVGRPAERAVTEATTQFDSAFGRQTSDLFGDDA